LRPLRIGLLGLGTVGAGTYRMIQRNQAEILARTGRALQVVAVAVRNLERARAVVGSDVDLTCDPFAVVMRRDLDVVVEAIGGTGVARALVLQAIAQGKHVVTANKALLAEHGQEIFAAAQSQGVIVAYEGAVAVSIPIIKALRESLVANRIEWVAGIVNGTSNFILSQMRDKGFGFAAALQDAQAQGYAEADPRLDVEGVDAAHKISLLAANAFGSPVPFDQVPVQGIADIDALDMAYAEHLGFRIKLLALARRCMNGNPVGLEVRVHPALVPTDHALASVNGAMNTVMVKGDASGITLYYGAGAGSEQTASAVIADLVDVARMADALPSQRVPYLAFQPHAQQPMPLRATPGQSSAYYLRVACDHSATTERTLLRTLARAGVQARIHGRYTLADRSVHHVLLTQALQHRVVQQVLEQLAHAKLPVKAIRVERLE
jgi:homoserine dehydrogenase